jgi:hypothetical protein
MLATRNFQRSFPWDVRPVQLDPNNPHVYLALAAIRLAILDTRRGDDLAQWWLLNEGLSWMQMIVPGFDPTWWAGWVKAGCPGKCSRRGRPRQKIAKQGRNRNPV